MLYIFRFFFNRCNTVPLFTALDLQVVWRPFPLLDFRVICNKEISNPFITNMIMPLAELPQLRSATSMELGCDPHGYSRAGYDTVIWYCAIAVGRLSPELNKMREVCFAFPFEISIIYLTM